MIDLESIKDPSFIKDLSMKELYELCDQIRDFLIKNISVTGGHLSSNLGVVELTVAMYYVFDPATDEFLFDVGHQSYVHKILTGRAKDFKTLRQYNGLSGYIKRSESQYDIWESGHSSTSISAAAGLMISDDSKRPVVVIGDASISNGVAFEGLNYIGQIKNRCPIIIFNDNKMGISKSVGALTKTFLRLRSTKLLRGLKSGFQKILPNPLIRLGHQIKKSFKGLIQQDNMFEDLGFDYYGPYYGNKLKSIIRLFQRVKKNKDPVVLHLLTEKGKGYAPSENDTEGSFHGVGPFDLATGKEINIDNSKISYSEAVANYLVNKREQEQFFVITPAMKNGAYLKEFADKYEKDFIDVGIAEEHAAVMSAGIAIHNKRVVLLMYSTFAQRAYDEILNDIARQNLKVIIGIDRAGIVGEDGETHQGLYDVSMFMGMPNIIVTMPRTIKEAIGLFNYAFSVDNPIVIRYPKQSEAREAFDYNFVTDLSWETINEGNKGIIVGYGGDIERINILVKNNSLDIEVIDAKCIKPCDNNKLKEMFESNKNILVVEQIISSGALYDKVLEYKEENNYNSRIYKHSFNCDTIIPHGNKKDIYKAYGFSDDELLELIKNTFKL